MSNTIYAPYSQAVMLDVDVTPADITYLNANPEAIPDLWTGRKAHPTLSFDKTNFKNYYPSNERIASSGVADLVPALGVEVAKSNPILLDHTDSGDGLSITNNPDGSVTIKCDNYSGPRKLWVATQKPITPIDNSAYYLTTIDYEVISNANSIPSSRWNAWNTSDAHFNVLRLDMSKTGVRKTVSIIENPNINSLYNNLGLMAQLEDGSTTPVSFEYKVYSVSSKKIAVSKIKNYKFISASLFRYKNYNKGPQDIFFKKDASGILSGFTADGTIWGDADGRWVKLPLADNTKQHHLITKCLTRMHGNIGKIDDTECTP